MNSSCSPYVGREIRPVRGVYRKLVYGMDAERTDKKGILITCTLILFTMVTLLEGVLR